MKVLIISFRYAPFNSIGTNRVLAMVNHFKQNNIDYKVITSFVDSHNDSCLEIDPNVHYIPWFDFRSFKYHRSNIYKAKTNNSDAVTQSKPEVFLKKIAKWRSSLHIVLDFFLFPDPYIGWAFNAVFKANRIVKEYKPDLVISTSYPYSSHIVGAYFANRYNCKWFAELRDPWVGNHIKSGRYKWRDVLDKWISRLVFRRVTLFVTVSEVWKNDLMKLYHKEAAVVRNGFLDKKQEDQNTSSPDVKHAKKRILYAGTVFPENQDIYGFMKFFIQDQVISNEYEFIYVGPNKTLLSSYQERLNYTGNNILLFDKVDHLTSIRMQNESDMLLLFNWENGSKGIIPGKFYEYIGANKPIILWNNKIENELVDLCLGYNEKNNNGKVIIINELESARYSILNFVFESSNMYALEYSRRYQFDKLITLMHEHC